MSIVIAYTPDAQGAAALKAGLARATAAGEKVVVVNATRGDAYVDTSYSRAETWEDIQATLADSGLEHETRRPVGKDVADLVLEAASDVGATLIVVGLKHRSPVGKLIMGSVAQRILLDAGCPVLAVKP